MIDHVFLPPQLPDQPEQELAWNEEKLVPIVKDCLDNFLRHDPPGDLATWYSLVRMLGAWPSLQKDAGLEVERLSESLSSLRVHGE